MAVKLASKHLEDNGCSFARAVVFACFSESGAKCCDCPFPVCIEGKMPDGYALNNQEKHAYTQGFIDAIMRYYPAGIAEGVKSKVDKKWLKN